MKILPRNAKSPRRDGRARGFVAVRTTPVYAEAVDARAEQIGKNEAVFRAVNEQVKDVHVGFGVGSPNAEFVCECGDGDCVERVAMTLDEYEHVRADATTFAVRRGHELPDVETVVEEREGYLVVRKRAGDPATIAVQADPRR
jgi:hypothetical protein